VKFKCNRDFTSRIEQTIQTIKPAADTQLLKRTVIKSLITLAVGGIFLIASQRHAQTAPSVQDPSRNSLASEGLEFFEKKIRPALAENWASLKSGCRSRGNPMTVFPKFSPPD
jgi:hypothetical protein